eukprot:8435094-Pyramimonas_sp.AAC.1
MGITTNPTTMLCCVRTALQGLAKAAVMSQLLRVALDVPPMLTPTRLFVYRVSFERVGAHRRNHHSDHHR